MKTLKEQYLENAEKYSEGMKNLFEEKIDDKKLIAKYWRMEKSGSKKCHDIFLKLRETNELHQIEEFMFHKSRYVRYLASAECLFSNPKIAEKTLEELIELPTPNHIRMHALATLKAWRNISWSEGDRYK